MRRILTILFLLIYSALFGQDIKPISPNFKALQSPSFSYFTTDSSVWIYKGALYGWTELAKASDVKIKNAKNGLYLSGDTVKLGGDLSEDTNINVNDKSFFVYQKDRGINIQKDITSLYVENDSAQMLFSLDDISSVMSNDFHNNTVGNQTSRIELMKDSIGIRSVRTPIDDGTSTSEIYIKPNKIEAYQYEDRGIPMSETKRGAIQDSTGIKYININKLHFRDSTLIPKYYLEESIKDNLDEYVPYEGAKKDVDLNKHTLKASSIVLLKDSVPQIVQEGQMYWDSITQSVVVNTEDPDVHLNVGEELWVPICKNSSGVNILNGDPVYISGSTDGYPTITLASNISYTESRLIGVATDDIPNGSYGRVTRFGYVNDINLSSCSPGDNVYLGDKVLTHIRPTGGNFPVVIGKAITCSLHGKLLVYPQSVEYSAEVNQAYGWPSYLQGEQTTLSFTNATRTFTITPVLSTFYFYQAGVKYIKTGTQYFQITDVEGIHFLYYDQGVIYDQVNPSRDQALNIIRNSVTISAIYWDATNKVAIYNSNERHTFYWPSWVHAFVHLSFGTQYSYGLGLTNITLGLGTTNSDAQFGVDSGAISDEDITSTTDVIASTAGLPIYSRTGADGLWRRTTRSGYSFLNDGTTGLAMYNLYSGGTWSIVSMTNNYYRLVHVFATNDIGLNKTIVMSGVAQYSSAAAAEAGVNAEIANIYNSNLPFAEVKHIGSLILHTKTGLGNSVNARYVATTTGGAWLDYRRSNVIPTASSGGSGVSTFLSLSDTPSSYAGHANKLIGVDSGETGVEFKDATKNNSGLNIPSGQTYNVDNLPIITQQIRNGITVSSPSEDAVHDAIAYLASEKLVNSYTNSLPITNSNITVNFPTAMSNNNYFLSIRAYYPEVINGRNIQMENAVYNFSKTISGFSLSVDTVAGYLEYFAADSTNVFDAIVPNLVTQNDSTVMFVTPYQLNQKNYIRNNQETDQVYTSSSWYNTTNNSTNWDSAYTDRLRWDGGATGLVAATGRTSLGASTLGSNLFTITNPSAITFPRFNADNTVSTLSASDLKTAIDGGITNSNQIIKFDSGSNEGTDLYTFNGSSNKTIDIKAGTNIALTKESGSITISSSGGGNVYRPYQNGEMQPNGSGSTSMLYTGIFGGTTSSQAGISSGFDDYGIYLSQASTSTARYYSNLIIKTEQLPTVYSKVSQSVTSGNSIYCMLSTGTSYNSDNAAIGIVGISGDTNYKFITKLTGTTNITTTDTGIARTTNVLIMVIKVNSTTSVTFELLDSNYTVLYTATHTTNIPTATNFRYLIQLSSSSGNIKHYHHYITLKN